MVFTKDILIISSSWKFNKKVRSEEDGLDLRSIQRSSVKGLIENSNWLIGELFFLWEGVVHYQLPEDVGQSGEYLPWAINSCYHQIEHRSPTLFCGYQHHSRAHFEWYVDHIQGRFPRWNFLWLVFSLSRGLHRDTTSKFPKGGEVLSLGCSFLNWISNCIRFWKAIVKLYIMVQGVWTKM